MFEDGLVRFCAPVLLGKKPAALFPKKNWWEEGFFCGGNPYMEFLTLSRAGGALILAYRPDLLAATLENHDVRGVLEKLDYPPAGGVEEYLRHLSWRFLASEEFPHEVGFFLGYPPEDVLGFIHHRGAHSKFCGMWKVYGDVAKADALFREYGRCKQRLLEYFQNGGVLQGSANLLSGRR
ncbi:MAG: DUF3793 family protein [Treponema sp.]|jgi:hypothetical protein|nr:DUF3793 family protein [Treponema sp.]